MSAQIDIYPSIEDVIKALEILYGPQVDLDELVIMYEGEDESMVTLSKDFKIKVTGTHNSNGKVKARAGDSGNSDSEEPFYELADFYKSKQSIDIDPND